MYKIWLTRVFIAVISSTMVAFGSQLRDQNHHYIGGFLLSSSLVLGYFYARIEMKWLKKLKK